VGNDLFTNYDKLPKLGHGFLGPENEHGHRIFFAPSLKHFSETSIRRFFEEYLFLRLKSFRIIEGPFSAKVRNVLLLGRSNPQQLSIPIRVGDLSVDIKEKFVMIRHGRVIASEVPYRLQILLCFLEK
jgi:hypothetical protein